MRRNFLLLMLLALLPLASFATPNISDVVVQENGKGLKFKVLSCYKTTTAVKLNTVEVSQADWEANADDATILSIPDKITFAVVGNDDDDVAVNQSIEFTVVKIADNGFKGLGMLESVSIPATVTNIGSKAFEGDYALTTLSIAEGSNLATIGEEAFNSWITPTFDLSKATKLEELPNNLLTTASARAGAGNMYITEVKLPTSIKDINTALAYLPNLATVNWAQLTKLASLEANALAGNTKITELELPASVKTIGANALATSAVTTLTINAYTDNTQTIGALGVDLESLTVKGVFKGTFNGCGKVANVTFENEFQGAIDAGTFTDVENVTFATYKPATPANVAVGCIVLKNADDVFPIVTFGELAKAITGSAITGVTYNADKSYVTLKVGKISADLSAATAIVSAGVKDAIVTDIVDNKLALDIFGDARTLTFKGDIKNHTVAAVNAMANLATIDFEGHELKNTFAAASLEKLTGLKTVKWTPADAKATAAFDIKAFKATKVNDLDDASIITMTTTTKVAYTLYNWDPANKDETLYRVKFVATAPTPEVVTSTIKFEGEVAPDGYYYATVYIPSTQECSIDKVDGLTVYSVYLDGADIYNNPLRVYDGKYYINGANPICAGLIVKSKSNADVTVTNTAGSMKQSIQNQANLYDGLLYNAGSAITGAQIVMENTQFTLIDGATTVAYGALTDPHDAIVRVSNPKDTKYVRYADFDPTTAPTKAIASKGFFLLAKKVAAGAPRQVIWLDDMGNTTAIETVEAVAEKVNNNVIYNIAGQKVSADYKGLVIKNGKKFIQK